MDPVLGADSPLVFEFVFEEPVTKRRVILVKIVKNVQDLRVITIPVTDRVFEPLVMPLGREPKDPARRHHRHPDLGTGSGHLTDEREHHSPGKLAWER